MKSKPTDLSRLCVHTLTTKPWSLEQCVWNYKKAGIKGITVWRNVLENQNLKTAKKLLEDNEMTVVSVARGGFFPSTNEKKEEHQSMTTFWLLNNQLQLELLSLYWFAVEMENNPLKNRENK